MSGMKNSKTYPKISTEGRKLIFCKICETMELFWFTISVIGPNRHDTGQDDDDWADVATN
jgi:hypothetical protein